MLLAAVLLAAVLLAAVLLAAVLLAAVLLAAVLLAAVLLDTDGTAAGWIDNQVSVWPHRAHVLVISEAASICEISAT